MARKKTSSAPSESNAYAQDSDAAKRQPRADDRCACGSSLLSDFQCADSGLWPRYVWRLDSAVSHDPFTLQVPCPFACPICRGALQWDGGCLTCYGSRTSADRETWTFPGDRYEREEQKSGEPAMLIHGHHWIRVCGPRRACSVEDNQQAALLMAGLLARIGT